MGGTARENPSRDWPTSQDWERTSGLVLSLVNDKQAQHARVKSLGLPYLEFMRYTGDDAAVERFFEEQAPVALVAVGKDTRRVELGMRHPREFHAARRLGSPNGHWEFFLGNTVEALPGSYVGTAVSDGCGRLYMEFVVRPFMTEIRELTAGASERKDMGYCYVENFDDVVLTTDRVPSTDLRYLRSELGGIRGYFELIKGLKRGRAGIYFLQYENTDPFRNVLTVTDACHFNLADRVRSVWLKWHQQ